MILAGLVEGTRSRTATPEPLHWPPGSLSRFLQQRPAGAPARAGRAIFRSARAAATLRAYEHDWQQFRAWCERNGLLPLPASPQAVILYSTDLTKNQHKRWNALSRRLAAISQLHQQAGFDSPTRTWAVQQFLSGLRRVARPLDLSMINPIVARSALAAGLGKQLSPHWMRHAHASQALYNGTPAARAPGHARP